MGQSGRLERVSMTAPLVGDTVTGLRFGGKRRQTVRVELVEETVVAGYLVSRKHPGDFRGWIALDPATVRVVSA